MKNLLTFALLILATTVSALHAQIYVTEGTGVGVFNSNTGAVINSALISTGYSNPNGVAIYGSDLLVSNYGSNTVSEYNLTTGSLLSSSLFSGLLGNSDLLVSGNDLFIGNGGGHDVLEYNLTTNSLINTFSASTSTFPHGMELIGNTLYVTTPTASGATSIATYNATTGALLNSNFINLGSTSAGFGMTVIGGNIYVADEGLNAVYEYNATTGAMVGTGAVITGLNGPFDVYASNNDLYVANQNSGVVGEYSSTGGVINASLITGLSGATSLDVLPQAAVPEPRSYAFALLVLGSLVFARYGRHSFSGALA